MRREDSASISSVEKGIFSMSPRKLKNEEADSPADCRM